MTTATLYSIPEEPGRWRALAMAATVHAALFALLWIGIRWQSETPVTVEAEVWSPQSQEAAPLPEPVREIKPEPIPVPIEKPSATTEAPPIVKPDIALEQKKKRQAEEKVRLEKLAEKEKQQRIEDEKTAALEKQNKIKAEKTTVEKKRLQDEAEEKQLAKAREQELRRISGNTGSGGLGEATKSQGSRTDPGYAHKIKRNTRFVVPPDLRGNPSVEYTVELFPDGTVRNIDKNHASGLPGFDEAVERAIRSSAPFPADNSGKVPPSFTFTHQPKEK